MYKILTENHHMTSLPHPVPDFPSQICLQSAPVVPTGCFRTEPLLALSPPENSQDIQCRCRNNACRKGRTGHRRSDPRLSTGDSRPSLDGCDRTDEIDVRHLLTHGFGVREMLKIALRRKDRKREGLWVAAREQATLSS